MREIGDEGDDRVKRDAEHQHGGADGGEAVVAAANVNFLMQSSQIPCCLNEIHPF